MEKTYETLDRIWEDNYVAIAMSSSNEYLPYLSVYLQSIIDNSQPENKYDIIIFSNANETYHKKLIINSFTKENVSIRFVNPKEILQGIKLKITHSYFHEACYYRITAPLILNKFKRIIFTDIDLVCQKDIYELGNINLGAAPLAARKEPIWESFIDNNDSIHYINIREYSYNILKLTDIKTYYNTGVVVYNVEEFIKNDYFKQLLNAINDNSFLYQEQCALNYVLNDKILPIDSSWNFEISPRLVGEIKSDTKIVHFLGGKKPWFYPNEKYSDIWWKYARKSPFYEIIIDRLFQERINSGKIDINTNIKNNLENQIRMNKNELEKNIKAVMQYRFNVANYWKCKILSKITTGERKMHYEEKKLMLKEKIRARKRIVKGK